MPEWLIKAALRPNRTPLPFKAPATAEAATGQLRRIVQTVIGAPVGNRNRILFWAACRIGGLVKQGLLREEAACVLLLEAGQHAGLAQSEALATSLSGLRQGQQDATDVC